MNSNGPFEAFDNSRPKITISKKMAEELKTIDIDVTAIPTDWPPPELMFLTKGGAVKMTPLESIEIGNGFLPEETGGELEMNLNLQTIINALYSPKSIVTAKRDPFKGINILIENYDEKETEEWKTAEKASSEATEKPIEHRFELMLYNADGWMIDEVEGQMPFATIEKAKEGASQLFEDFEDLAFIKIREIVVAKENSDVIDREFLFPGFDKKTMHEEKEEKPKGKVLRKNIKKAEKIADRIGETPTSPENEYAFGFLHGFRKAIEFIKEEGVTEKEILDKSDGFGRDEF